MKLNCFLEGLLVARLGKIDKWNWNWAYFLYALQLVICCGFSTTFLLGNAVSWRILALIGNAPCILHIIGVFFIPESPRWLAKTGREKELEVALQRLRGENTDISQELAEIKGYTEICQRLSEDRILDLFQWKYAHSLVVGVGLMLLQQLAGSIAIPSYAGSIFESAGFCSWNVLELLDYRNIILITGSSQVEGAHSYYGSYWHGGIFGMVLTRLQRTTMGYHFRDISSKTYIKGSAGSLVTFIVWSSSTIVVYVFNFMFEWNSAGTFFIFSVFSAATVLFTIKLVPETKGQTLEEVQASMTQFLQH
ncbi:Sugar transporter ERD6-like 5 [Vitis vinifera]|uniref:Sugar transporter ERD6-like 5 n=1 Tax=Vitis vinifera TaxID=29760 RepID=A0A438F050_VITVI|nr:Sugar transporter ERD6-like 5 [Vitis vinifera]